MARILIGEAVVVVKVDPKSILQDNPNLYLGMVGYYGGMVRRKVIHSHFQCRIIKFKANALWVGMHIREMTPERAARLKKGTKLAIVVEPLRTWKGVISHEQVHRPPRDAGEAVGE